MPTKNPIATPLYGIPVMIQTASTRLMMARHHEQPGVRRPLHHATPSRMMPAMRRQMPIDDRERDGARERIGDEVPPDDDVQHADDRLPTPVARWCPAP